jgi:hypothetical protein
MISTTPSGANRPACTVALAGNSPGRNPR